MDSNLIVKWCALVPLLAVAACASQRPAPVVDRSGRSPVSATTPTTAPTVSRSAKDGIYVAQRGDTLQNVAVAFGVDPKDLARWNGVRESEVLIPGQTLQVTPPASVATVSPITGSGQAEVRPLPPPGASTPGAPATLPPAVAPPTATPPVAAHRRQQCRPRQLRPSRRARHQRRCHGFGRLPAKSSKPSTIRATRVSISRATKVRPCKRRPTARWSTSAAQSAATAIW